MQVLPLNVRLILRLCIARSKPLFMIRDRKVETFDVPLVVILEVNPSEMLVLLSAALGTKMNENVRVLSRQMSVIRLMTIFVMTRVIPLASFPRVLLLLFRPVKVRLVVRVFVVRPFPMVPLLLNSPVTILFVVETVFG